MSDAFQLPLSFSFTTPSFDIAVLVNAPCHSIFCLYLNCAWNNDPPSSIVAVIAGAVKDNLSAITDLMAAFNCAFNWSVVSALITLLVPPAFAILSNCLIPFELKPPP